MSLYFFTFLCLCICFFFFCICFYLVYSWSSQSRTIKAFETLVDILTLPVRSYINQSRLSNHGDEMYLPIKWEKYNLFLLMLWGFESIWVKLSSTNIASLFPLGITLTLNAGTEGPGKEPSTYEALYFNPGKKTFPRRHYSICHCTNLGYMLLINQFMAKWHWIIMLHLGMRIRIYPLSKLSYLYQTPK